MSLYYYQASIKLHSGDHSVSSLLMAAMRKADFRNLPKLQSAWPGLWAELQERHNAPGGHAEEDQDVLELVEALWPLVDPDPCSLDRNGGCQAHMSFGSGECTNAIAARMVEKHGVAGSE